MPVDFPRPADALLEWVEDASEALDEGRATADAFRALAARPTQRRPRAILKGRTAYLEEFEDLYRTQMRDPFPAKGTQEERRAWWERQERRASQLSDILDMHVEAIVCAVLHVMRKREATKPRRAPRPRRRAELALAGTLEALRAEDPAA